MKIRAILSTLIAVLIVAAAIPIGFADTVTTNADVGSSVHEPVIEKIIVLDPNNDESGDLGHNVAGTQIEPLPGDAMTEVFTPFWKYAIISDPVGRDDISQVFEWLTYPDGYETDEVTATKMNYTDAMVILNAALVAGLVDDSIVLNPANGFTEHDTLEWMLRDDKNQAYMFKIENDLNNHNEPGMYTVNFKAVDLTGGQGLATGQFEYMSLEAIQLDFDTIDYGLVQIGVQKWASGDDFFDVSLTSNLPTVKNQGNVDIQLVVGASSMWGTDQDKISQELPADYLSVEFMGEHVNSVYAVAPEIPGSGLATPVPLQGVLTPCTPTQISFDLWIDPAAGVAANNYVGTMEITIA
jgi:hypothetical protein